jgi:hypothetical protein
VEIIELIDGWRRESGRLSKRGTNGIDAVGVKFERSEGEGEAIPVY